jgi:hypothetical protein
MMIFSGWHYIEQMPQGGMLSSRGILPVVVILRLRLDIFFISIVEHVVAERRTIDNGHHGPIIWNELEMLIVKSGIAATKVRGFMEP